MDGLESSAEARRGDVARLPLRLLSNLEASRAWADGEIPWRTVQEGLVERLNAFVRECPSTVLGRCSYREEERWVEVSGLLEFLDDEAAVEEHVEKRRERQVIDANA